MATDTDEMDRGSSSNENLNNFTPLFKSPSYNLCGNDSDLNYTTSLYCDPTQHTTFYENETLSHNYEMEKIVSVVVPILFGIIFIVGLFGNALVVIVVASNKQMRNTTNLLIINLAIADLLFIIFCVPFTASDYVFDYWPYGEVWCKLVQYLIVVTAYASVYTLVLMSVDRFLAVVYPVASMSIRTEKNALLAIVITWIFILLSCLPAFEAHGIVSFEFNQEENLVCTFLRDYNYVLFQIIFLLTSYAIPLTLICSLYCAMLFRLFKSSSTMTNSRQTQRGKKRVTRMVVVVVLVFAFCWCPIQVVLVLKSLNLYQISDLSVAFQITAHILGYLNSCVNPILYTFLSPNFRKAFLKVIQCKGLGADNDRNRSMKITNASKSGKGQKAQGTTVGAENTKETTLLADHFEQNGGNHNLNNKMAILDVEKEQFELEEDDDNDIL